MKRFKKTICIIMTLVLIVSATVIARATGTETGTGTNTISITTGNKELDIKVVEILTSYADARKNLLVTGDKSGFSNVAFDGIISDEEVHKAYLDENNIQVLDSAFEITGMQDEEYQITVTAKERVTLSTLLANVADTEHIIRIFYTEDDKLIVASDNYRDGYSGFESASYVDPTEEPEISLDAAGSATCIVGIAKNEIGYLEKASNSDLDSFTKNAGENNYTKYGAWYGANGIAWCAIFVSWCANQSSVSTSIIPKYSECTNGLNKFKNWGRFYKRSSSYTPKVGDIFFTGTESDSNHTGIVVGVTSSKITVVDGNCDNQVSTHTYSRTDTSLVGYGNPNYGSETHTYSYTSNSGYHWKECGACGVELTRSAHKWVLNSAGTLYTCSVCKRTTTSAPSTSSI